MRSWRVVFLSFGALVLAVAVRAEPAAKACFRRADNRLVRYGVFQVGAPPVYSKAARDYPDQSPVYPASDFLSAFLPRVVLPDQPSSSGFKFNKYFFMWVNRCVFIPGKTPEEGACRNKKRVKANGYFNIAKSADGEQIRPVYTTYEKADACTIVQLKRLLGASSESLRAEATSAGLTLWDSPDRDQFRAMAVATPTAIGKVMPYLVDLCILETSSIGDSSGIVLDYEVWDDRTPAQTTDIVRKLHAIAAAKGKQLLFATNPIPRRPSGVDTTNVRDIIDATDGFLPSISTGATIGNETIHMAPHDRSSSPWQSYSDQLAVLTNNGQYPLTEKQCAKIAWNIGLYDISLAEAEKLGSEIKSQHYRGLMISRDFLKQGGSCTRPENQITACLTMGVCTGRFGFDRR